MYMQSEVGGGKAADGRLILCGFALSERRRRRLGANAGRKLGASLKRLTSKWFKLL